MIVVDTIQNLKFEITSVVLYFYITEVILNFYVNTNDY